MTALSHSTAKAVAAHPRPRRAYQRVDQPADVINVPGALLRIETLARLSGQSRATLYRAAQRGELVLTKRGARCTRVTSENARAYLARAAAGGAA
jgi:hypothetical protein